MAIYPKDGLTKGFEYVIVSRHPAAIAFIQKMDERFVGAPTFAAVTAEDVRGKVVAGNLPLHLAAHTYKVVAVEFKGDAPRGHEYTLEDMEEAGATLVEYAVCGWSNWVEIAIWEGAI